MTGRGITVVKPMKGRPQHVKCKVEGVSERERLKKKGRKRKMEHLTEQRNKTEHKWKKQS